MSYRSDRPSPPPDTYQILAIEDDDRDWKLIERALGKAKTVRFVSARVSHLNNGLVALRHRAYDAVLLDLILQYDGPANGLDTVIQVVKEAPSTPIIVLSSLDDIEMAVQAVEYGAAAYVEKPPDAHRLESIIRQSVERHIRDEVTRRLTWESLAQLTSAKDLHLLAAAIGGHLDNLERGIHHIRSYLSNTAPHHAAEIDKILGWGHIMTSMAEIRKVLRLQAPQDRETLPPPEETSEGPPTRRLRRPQHRAISERALRKIKASGFGAPSSIKTPDDAKAYLLSLQTEEMPEDGP